MSSETFTEEKYDIMTEINMIPLIDVALVLLIIFMIMTPFLVQSQLRVNLPRAGTGEQPLAAYHQLEIEVMANGDIFVDGNLTPPDALEATIRTAVETGGVEGIIMLVDKAVDFQSFITVMDAGRKVGVEKINVTVRTSPASAPPQ